MKSIETRETERSLIAAGGLYLLAAMGLVLFAFGAGGTSRLLTELFPGITQEWLTLTVNILYYGVFVFVPCALWAANRKDGAEVLKLNPLSLGATVRVTIIALMAVLGMYNVTAVWTALWQKLGFNVFVQQYIRPETTGELTRSVLSAAVVAGISEELLFHGVMMSAWEKRGAKQGIVFTALLFTMLHGSVLGFPAELLCGILLAVIVRWTNSLYAGMIFHSAYNAALVMLNYLSTAPAAAEAAETTEDLMALIGGGAGVFSLLLDTVFAALFIWILLQRFRMLHAMRRRASKLMDEAEAWREQRRIRREELTGEPASEDELPLLFPRVVHMPPLSAAAEKAPAVHNPPLPSGVICITAAGLLAAALLYGLDLWSMLV